MYWVKKGADRLEAPIVKKTLQLYLDNFEA